METVAFVAVSGNASMLEAILHLKWKETLFFCCLMLRKPHASGPVCAAWMGFLNGLSWFSVCGPPWPCGLLFATVYCISSLFCFCRSCDVCMCFWQGKIPWKHPDVENELLEFDLLSLWEKNMLFKPGFHFLDKMSKYNSNRSLCQLKQWTQLWQENVQIQL